MPVPVYSLFFSSVVVRIPPLLHIYRNGWDIRLSSHLFYQAKLLITVDISSYTLHPRMPLCLTTIQPLSLFLLLLYCILSNTFQDFHHGRSHSTKIYPFVL